MADLACVPAVAFGIFKIVRKVSAVNQQFFRDTAAHDAGATNPQVLDHGNLFAVPLGRKARRTHTA